VFPGVVNQNFDHMIAEYRKVKEALITYQEKYDQNSGTITKLTNELSEISVRAQAICRGLGFGWANQAPACIACNKNARFKHAIMGLF